MRLFALFLVCLVLVILHNVNANTVYQAITAPDGIPYICEELSANVVCTKFLGGPEDVVYGNGDFTENNGHYSISPNSTEWVTFQSPAPLQNFGWKFNNTEGFETVSVRNLLEDTITSYHRECRTSN